MRIFADCVRTWSRKIWKELSSVDLHSKVSRSSPGNTARRSDFNSLSSCAVPPAKRYSFRTFSHSAMPSSTFSSEEMGFICSIFTSLRNVSSLIDRP